MDKESTNKIKMTRKELLSILQKETDGFNEQSRLRDDVLDAMEVAYLKGGREQLTIPDVVSTSFCDTVECSNCGLERDFDGCIVCGES
jgi:hypothetical protein